MSTTIVQAPSRDVVRKAATAGFLGTAVEAYDFFVFTFLIAYIAPQFFPSGDPTVGILQTLLVLGTGFLARPIGGIIFGRMGDRHGRRITLVVTIAGMGIATCLMGLLPTHASVGVWAPIMLVLVRLLQGLAAGGEQMGSATFVTEHASLKNHGILSAMTPMGFALGTALAPGAVALVAALTSEEFMHGWGWRIPLLLSLPLAFIALYLRNSLEESPEFRRLADLREVRNSPIRDLFRGHLGDLFKVIAISAAVLAMGYVISGYLPLFLQQEVGLLTGTTAGIASIAAFVAIALALSAGFIIDRIGRRATLILIFALLGILIFPAMWMMNNSGANVVVIAALQTILVSMAGAVAVPAYAAFTSIFPPSVRYTGAAIGFGVGSAIGGGFGPYLAGQATAITGSPYAPAIVIALAAVIGIAIAATIAPHAVAQDAQDAHTSEAVPHE
ncbi:MAG: MFS transporter [Actinomycetota bacterium]